VSLLVDPVRRDRSPGIDCLRGFLALYVLFGHMVPWALITTGNTTIVTRISNWLVATFQGHSETNPAVLGFIVLSGYCIHRNGLRAGNFNVRGYAIRRAFRIAPVYILGSAIGVVLLVGASPTGHLLAETPSISVGGVLTKLATIGALVLSKYFESFQGNAPLGTVAAEMWLYVFYALMVRSRLLWPTVAILWLAGFAWVSQHPAFVSWWYLGSLVSFLPFWWLGALFVNPTFVGRRPKVLIVAGLLWLELTIALDRYTGSLWAIEARKFMLAILFGGVIVLLDGLRHRVLNLGALVGRAGYSIYALHGPIIIALLIAGIPGWVCAVVALAAAMTSFLLYERPLLRMGARLANDLSSRLSTPREPP
jgi:peptidoglycan/LPS O-acetylase OafA/YrhL